MKITDAIPLKDFAAGRSQEQIAVALGVTQGSVSQMLKSKRNIWVRALAGGRFQAYELKPVGRNPAEPAAA
ncbi:Cro/CI family transcriptional regulator [Halopseudomonas sp.]|uniref:Cro/CI family transcriptional regulator n=1 Tax=Halopseudomonas sp. TaxID=2901191 RepID=UPI00311E2FF2